MPHLVAPYLVPDDVVAYCAAHQLTPYLEIALRLAEETFAPIERLEVGVEPDPEVDEEYVVIDLWARLSVDEGISRKERYTHRWVASVPPSVIGKIRLLSYPLPV